MRIQPKDLSTALQNNLDSLYFICGEEPLQRMEALDKIRTIATHREEMERESIELSTAKDLDALQVLLQTDSLFSEHRFIECRLNPNKNAATLLEPLVNLLKNFFLMSSQTRNTKTVKNDTVKNGTVNSDADNRGTIKSGAVKSGNVKNKVIAIFYPEKLDSARLKSSWFLALESMATIVIANTMPRAQFSQWIVERAKQHGLHFEKDAILFFAERTEGNLTAASQTLEKLALLNHSHHTPDKLSLDKIAPEIASDKHAPDKLGPITVASLKSMMVWENHHSLFDLTDALLEGAYTRTYRILYSLRSEGIEPSLIGWAITREVRQLIPLAQILSKDGHIKDSVLDAHRVWKQKRPLITSCLKKYPLSFLYEFLIQAQIKDTLIKTRESKQAFSALEELCHFWLGQVGTTQRQAGTIPRHIGTTVQVGTTTVQSGTQ